MQLSPQQLAVLDWVHADKGSLNVIARAGTGKTTLLMEICKVIKGSGFLGAFNKAIADEFKQRLAAQKSFNVTGSTIHSAGLSAWRKVAPRVQIEGRKVQIIARKKYAWDKKLVAAICETVSYAKQACLGVGIPYTEDQPWQDIIDYYDLQEEIPGGIAVDRFIDRCQEVYKESLEQCREVCDFDDMLLAPLAYSAPFKKYDWVMVDEGQDLNEARRRIMFAMMNGNSRMVLVGDDRQAIYGFAGATSNSMELVKAHLGSAELPLSVTYRCPKAVVQLAQTWVPDFTAHESAIQGLVTSMDHTNLWSQNYTYNDAILCRNTRPLVGIAKRLRKLGVQCVVEGMSAKGLVALAEKWGEDIKIDEFLDYLDRYEAQEVKKWTLKGDMEKVEYSQDRCGTMRDIAGELDGKTTRDLVKRIEWLFGDTGVQCLKLCTIHRSKGREWNRVYLIGRNRYMPSPYAKKDWELVQESNLAYVAVTRAKVELVEVEVPFKEPGEGLEWWER